MKKLPAAPPPPIDIWRGFLKADVWFFDPEWIDGDCRISAEANTDQLRELHAAMVCPLAEGLAIRRLDTQLLVVPWSRVYETRYDLASILPGVTVADAANTPSGITHG